MNINEIFKEDIDWILRCCEEKVAAYPSGMLQDGQAYLQELHFLKDSKRSSHFSYMIPFWFKEPFGLNIQACRTIALGNCFALLYFMSQDEVFDSNSSRLLPLSNLFYLDFVSQYRSLFSSDSSFWLYFEKYIHEWAQSILWEQTEHMGRAKPYLEEDLIRLSRKAAPLKIPFTAICILADREDEISHLADAMDYDQVVFQMIDDWRDWKEDLAKNSYTYLLMKVLDYCKLEGASLMAESHVRKAVFIGNVAEEVFEMALAYNQLSKNCVMNLNVPYLREYFELEESICKSIIDKIRQERASMMGGGFGMLMKQLKG